MGRKLGWLPPRSTLKRTDMEVPFVQATSDVVHVIILQLARGAWRTLARLLQLACLALDYKPLLAYELATAGATGVVLDVLCQAPRHHPTWRTLSTAGAGLLAVLVRCEDSTEAVQPQALRMLLVMLESDLTCGPARQAVATVLHCIVAQRTVHRDKLLAAGALAVLLRVLRRLDVLCDMIAVQEILWTLLYLTDEGALCSGDGQTGEYQPAVAEQLVPLLFLYGMPWHAQHGHLAALTTRALHAHVAGQDAGKYVLRAAGAVSVLVDLVRRHSAPYIAAAGGQPGGRSDRHGSRGLNGTTASDAAGSGAGSLAGGGEGGGAKGQQAEPLQQHKAPSGGDALVGRLYDGASRGSTHRSFAVGPARPPPHAGCEVHAAFSELCNGTEEYGPYGCPPAVALGPWTPWQRLLAVLLIHGIVPGLAPPCKRRTVSRLAAQLSATVCSDGGAAGALRGGPSESLSVVSVLSPDEGEEAGAAGVAKEGRGDKDGGDEEEEEDDVFGSNVSETGVVSPTAALADAVASAAAPPQMAAASQGPDVAGARVVCYGLLLPLLADGGEGTHCGAGAAATAVGGALLRRRLCPLREALATLKTLLCDCEANQLHAAEQGLASLLVQLVAHGDMGLAWQAAEAAVYLSGGATGAVLVAAGAAEEMSYLLQESADALHGLTLRKQIQLQASSLGHGDSTARGPHQQPQQRAPLPSGGSVAITTPAPLSAVHVRPNPYSAAQPGRRPQRVFLVGRLPLDFTTSNSCFYGSHDTLSYCDYCTPSAAIKVLLRLMAAEAGPAVEAEAEVCRRFAAAGGLYGVLLLLHHEGTGVHHSKLAASLLTLLDLVLMHVPEAQDEVRTAGGLGVLTTLLGSLMRPGVMDVYQLRVATCRTLGLALQGNAANKLAAREHGLLPLLVSLVTTLGEQRKARSGELVMDDNGPLTTASLDALAAAATDSPGTQEALVALGLMHPVCGLLMDERVDTEVRTAAVRALTAIADAYPVGQSGALVLGAVPPAVAWLERCCSEATASAAGAGGGGGRDRVVPLNAVEVAEPSRALAALLAALLAGGNTHAKAAIVAAGALPVLLQLLRIPETAGGAFSDAGTPMGDAANVPSAQAVAAGVLAALAEGDTDIQNELVAQGVLTAAADMVRDGSDAAPAALRLLSAVLRSNTFVKNTARQSALPATLVTAVRRCGLARSAAAAAAAAALTELAAGNHANQEAIAVQGGLEVAVDLMRDASAALPFGLLSTAAAACSAAAAFAAGGEAMGPGAEPMNASADDSISDDGRLQEGEDSRQGEGAGPGPGSAAAAAAAGARAGRRAFRSSGHGAAKAGAGAGSAAIDRLVEDAPIAASLCRLLRALFGLVCACVELNGGNKEYVRELGGVAVLGDFLLAATEALTATGPQATAGARLRRAARGAEATASGRLRDAATSLRAALSPAVAAACSAVAALVRESSANLARLQEQTGLAVALFKLLVASEAATSHAAALAIEWLVLRGVTHLDAPSREVFELDLVDTLALALYVPYGPVPFGGHDAAADDGLGGDALARQQQQQRLLLQQHHGPWYAPAKALMPAAGLTAAAVRDAAAVLTAVADAADALEAQQQQQQLLQAQAQPGPGSAQPGGGRGAMVKVVAGKPPAIMTHGALPHLDSVPLDALASDHGSGLVLSSNLAGRPAGHGGPGSQAWWAALAGSAAAAFQKVANGVLQGASAATPAAAAAAGGAAASGATAAAAAGAGPAGSVAAAGAGGGGARAGAGSGPSSPTAAAAQERRRQVTWMLFLLTVKSPDNRARVRRLVRASLTPLAQQLANAEACRAQLEAAAATAVEPSRGSATALGGGGGEDDPAVMSATLESISSLKGRLPVSTGAMEIGASERPELKVAQRSTSLGSAAAPSPPLFQPQPQQQQPQHPSLQQRPHHHQPHQPPYLAAGALANMGGSQPAGLPPQPAIHPRKSSSGAQPVQAGASPAGQPHGGANVLYGNMYGVPNPATPPSSVAVAPREPLRSPAPPVDASAAAADSVSPAAAAASMRFTRLSRAASGSAPVLSPTGAAPGNSSDAAAATAGPAGRISLTGAAAAAFAPYPGAPAAAGWGSRGPSPSTHRRGPVFLGPQDAVPASGLRPGAGAAGAPFAAAPQSPPPAAAGSSAPTATAAATAAPTSSQRRPHAQVSLGGSSGVMSDDDELAMIQQEVALLANTTRELTRGAGTPGMGAGALMAGAGQRVAGAASGSPGASPLRWGR